jgi:hypothetical protein
MPLGPLDRLNRQVFEVLRVGVHLVRAQVPVRLWSGLAVGESRVRPNGGEDMMGFPARRENTHMRFPLISSYHRFNVLFLFAVVRLLHQKQPAPSGKLIRLLDWYVGDMLFIPTQGIFSSAKMSLTFVVP